MSSTVTALLPAWQSAEFIQPTLDCLSAQTHADFRVSISVDLCDDDTFALCMTHAARDSRFEVVRQVERLGYVGNCNFLLGQARSNYVLFAFHDDILSPDYVGRLAAILDARPEVVLSYSDVLLTDVDGQTELWKFSGLEGVNNKVQRGAKMLKPPGFWWVPNRGLFRLNDARAIDGLKTHGAGEFSSDWPWLFHMSLLGEFARVPEVLCHKYYKPGSLSRTWEFSRRQYYEVRAACMREIWNSSLSTEEKMQLGVPLMSWLIKNKSFNQAASTPASAEPPIRK